MKKIKLIKIIIFVSIILIFSFASIFHEVNPYIDAEQRYRAEFPDTNDILTSMLNKEFIPAYEKYYNDNFYLREKLLNAKTIYDMNVEKTVKVSDVILSEDRTKAFRYRERVFHVNYDEQAQGFERWAEIKEYLDSVGTKLVVVGVPDQSHVFPEEYPKYAFNDNDRYLELRKTFFGGLKNLGIDYIDMHDTAYSDKDFYYTNADHHQNFNLTMEEYKDIINLVSNKYFPMENVIEKSELMTSDKEFIGSHNRKLFEKLDEDYRMQYLVPKEDISYTRYDNGKENDTPFFTDTKYYASYMGGDMPNTVVKTNRPELPNIMVLGDSTSNALESIVWMNANEFTSIDFRHYEDKDLIEYLEENPQDLIIVSVISGNYDSLLSIMK